MPKFRDYLSYWCQERDSNPRPPAYETRFFSFLKAIYGFLLPYFRDCVFLYISYNAIIVLKKVGPKSGTQKWDPQL